MKKLKILFVLVVFILSAFLGVYIVLNGDDILINFNIISLENKYTSFTLKHDLVKAAKYYKIEIYDGSNEKIYELETKKITNNFELTNLNYNEEYSVMVYAYDEVDDYRPANSEYKFIWNEATILNENIILNDKDYDLNIEGELKDKNYYLVIKDDEEEILNEKLLTNQYKISKDYYIGKEKKISVAIMADDKIVDSITLYNKINPVTDLKINLPKEEVIPYNDITLLFDGGDNASSINLFIYQDEKLLLKKEVNKNKIVMSKDIFKVGKTYKLEVVGSYDKYSKKDSVTFTMSEKEQLKPVYISNNWKYVKKGSKIVLKTHSSDAKIYYTLNGKNPESFGTLYTEPIEINENVILKTVAVSDGKINSIISEYKINVGEKRKLKVYLSPSNQRRNLGVSEVGYTNERDEMNDLSDYIEERLENSGVKVYRNNSSGNIDLWTKDSNYYGVDLHIAIHSNASVDHTAYGIETWIHNENSLTLSLGSIIQDNLMSIYPYKDRKNANRGVKYANGALGECNDEYLPFGILLEIAHHDDYDDALWMMENKKLIGYNIADSILEYYQVL